MLFGGIFAATAALRFASSPCRSASVNFGAFTAGFIAGSAGPSMCAKAGVAAVTNVAISPSVMNRFILLPR
jgi:hypothetical protein